MKQILVPIDPTEPARTREAIERAIRLYREEPVTVRLLRVQPKVSGHVAMFFGSSELRDLQQSAGAEDMLAAQAQLDAAGVPCISTVMVGRSAPTIVAAAHEYGCDRIVFGPDHASVAGSVFGSLAQQVRHILGTRAEAQVIGY